MKHTLFFLSLLIATAGFSAETVLFESNFSTEKDLSGWTDVHQKNPPDSKIYHLEKKDDGTLLVTTPSVMFGLSHALAKPVAITEKTGKIVLQVTFLHPAVSKGRQVRIALTSRKTTAQDSGGPFWSGKEDSGFLVCGYTYSIQRANYLACSLKGKQTLVTAENAPFSFFRKHDVPVTWKVVYDPKEKILAFFDTLEATEPKVEIFNVNLVGETLNAVWLGGFGTKYSKVKVWVEE